MTANPFIDRVNQRAKDLGVYKPAFQRMVYLEELLKQISKSEYGNNFVFKGGMECIALQREYPFQRLSILSIYCSATSWTAINILKSKRAPSILTGTVVWMVPSSPV